MDKKHSKRISRRPGAVVAIALGDGTYAFGRVLKEPLMAFYDLRADQIPPVNEIMQAKILFRIWVMNSAVTKGNWPIVGHAPLVEADQVLPTFFRRDAISGKFSLYRSGEAEVPATKEDCRGLERASVWSACHVEDRLRDHFAARPNKWVESMQP